MGVLDLHILKRLRRPKRHLLFATYDDFDKARDVVIELRSLDLKECIIDEIELYSPIEHPEVEEMLPEIDKPVERFTFFGAITGAILTFIFVAGVAQAMFTVQPQGGKPVIPIPPDMVITYEGTILFGVFSTLLAFFIYAGLPRSLAKHYSEKVSEDQIGIEVQVAPEHTEKVRAIFERYGALEIRELEV